MSAPIAVDRPSDASDSRRSSPRDAGVDSTNAFSATIDPGGSPISAGITTDAASSGSRSRYPKSPSGDGVGVRSRPARRCTPRSPGSDTSASRSRTLAHAATPRASSSARPPSGSRRTRECPLRKLDVDHLGVGAETLTWTPWARSSTFISWRLTAGSATLRSDTVFRASPERRALDHARRRMRVAAGHDRRALGQNRAERRAEPSSDVGRDVDVDEPRHAVAANTW